MCSESPVARGAAPPREAREGVGAAAGAQGPCTEGLHFVLMRRRMGQVNGELRVRQEPAPGASAPLGSSPRLHASHMVSHCSAACLSHAGCESTASPQRPPRVRGKGNGEASDTSARHARVRSCVPVLGTRGPLGSGEEAHVVPAGLAPQ